MSGGELVEDTRTLQDGDRVTARVVGRVYQVNDVGAFVMTDAGMAAFLPHDATTAERHPKPLPPEPPVGTEVLDGQHKVMRRSIVGWHDWLPTAGRWSTSFDLWPVVLERGPVRLLGDPIEAP